MTSNTDVTEWWQFFPSKAMGMAFSDRLLEGAQGIRLSGESIRCPPPRRWEPPPESSARSIPGRILPRSQRTLDGGNTTHSKPLVKLFKLTRGFSHPSAEAE